jgi:hypothetical protein
MHAWPTRPGAPSTGFAALPVARAAHPHYDQVQTTANLNYIYGL